jgi:HlyD family secretion protein
MAETNKKQKSALAVLVTAVFVVLVLVAVRGKPAVVPIVNITRADVSQTIASNGKVEPIDPMIARAEFPTFVSKVSAIEGQAVHRGQVILRLDSSDIQAQLAQARADLITAETSLRNAQGGGAPADVADLQSNLVAERADVAGLQQAQTQLQQLFVKQAVTKDDVDKNTTALEKARARLQALEQRQQAMQQQSGSDAQQAQLRVQQDQAQMSSLQEKLRSATVTATADGTLYSLPVHEGDFVKVGDELADLADLHQVRVRAFIDEPDMGMLQPGQTVQVAWDALPGRMWIGKTEEIPKQVVPRDRRSVAELLCSVDNSKLELLPNTNVDVKVLVHQSKNALVVPRGAVREENGQRFVFVFNGEEVKRRNVTLGVANASNYEVISGLQEGDRVAVPQDRVLHDGMRVQAA